MLHRREPHFDAGDGPNRAAAQEGGPEAHGQTQNVRSGSVWPLFMVFLVFSVPVVRTSTIRPARCCTQRTSRSPTVGDFAQFLSSHVINCVSGENLIPITEFPTTGGGFSVSSEVLSLGLSLSVRSPSMMIQNKTKVGAEKKVAETEKHFDGDEVRKSFLRFFVKLFLKYRHFMSSGGALCILFLAPSSCVSSLLTLPQMARPATATVGQICCSSATRSSRIAATKTE